VAGGGRHRDEQACRSEGCEEGAQKRGRRRAHAGAGRQASQYSSRQSIEGIQLQDTEIILSQDTAPHLQAGHALPPTCTVKLDHCYLLTHLQARSIRTPLPLNSDAHRSCNLSQVDIDQSAVISQVLQLLFDPDGGLGAALAPGADGNGHAVRTHAQNGALGRSVRPPAAPRSLPL
jgi:hypothetical protein